VEEAFHSLTNTNYSTMDVMHHNTKPRRWSTMVVLLSFLHQQHHTAGFHKKMGKKQFPKSMCRFEHRGIAATHAISRLPCWLAKNDLCLMYNTHLSQ